MQRSLLCSRDGADTKWAFGSLAALHVMKHMRVSVGWSGGSMEGLFACGERVLISVLHVL